MLVKFDDVGDLARLCRSSRLLNYMATPQLYRRIILSTLNEPSRIYEDFLYDGLWRASPFSMGLNALVTRKSASLTQELHLDGEWKEYGLEETVRTHRISDASVLLNIAVRAAIQNCKNLKHFKLVHIP